MSDQNTLAGSAAGDDPQPDETDSATETADTDDAAAGKAADGKDADAAAETDSGDKAGEGEDGGEADTDAEGEGDKDKDAARKKVESRDKDADARARRRQSAKERVEQAIGRQRAAERARDAAEARAKRAEERLKQYEGPPPKESDYATFEEFQAAQTAFELGKVNKREREGDVKDAREEARTHAEEAQAALADAFSEREREYADGIPDYWQLTRDPSLPISIPVLQQVQASERGPEVAYYLARNRAEAARLSKLSNPQDVAREIGRIEGRLTAPAPRKVTTAPKPVKAVATGAGSQADFDPVSASVEDVEKRLRAKGVIS